MSLRPCNPLSLFLAALLVIFGLSMVPARAQQTGVVQGRVIIMDYSGSMNQPINKGRQRRHDLALEVLETELDRLHAAGDTTPTAVLGFGNGWSWEGWKKANGYTSYNPMSYPSTGDGCADIQWMTRSGDAEFRKIDRGTTANWLDQAGRATSQGMTPLGKSIVQALRSLDLQAGAELILISDFDAPNCQDTSSFCDYVTLELGNLLNDAPAVDVKVIAVPTANTALLENCPVFRVDGVTAGQETPPAPRPTLTPLISVGTRQNADPAAFDDQLLDIYLQDSNGGRVRRGAPADMQVVPGSYTMIAALDGRDLASVDIVVTDDTTAALGLPGSQVVVRARNASGQLAVLDELTVARPGDSPFLTLGTEALPLTLELKHGDYVITAKAGSQSSQPLTIAAALNQSTDATLAFDSAPSVPLRDVAVAVSLGTPTLRGELQQALGTTFQDPAVQIIPATGPAIPLNSANWSGKLPLGSHVIKIDGAAEIALPFDVPPGSERLDVRVEVVPGWVTATAPVKGVFSLGLRGDLPVLAFEGTQLEHSLPEGTYDLKFEPADGPARTQSFSVRTGRRVVLSF